MLILSTLRWLVKRVLRRTSTAITRNAESSFTLDLGAYVSAFPHLVLPIPPPLGAGGDLGILATPTVAQGCVTPCFLFGGGFP